jgi:hypothetical protein
MSSFPLDELIENVSWMNWCPPLYAEKKFWENHKQNPECIMFPWALFIRGNKINDPNLKNLLKRTVDFHKQRNLLGEEIYTFCEDNQYMKIIPLLKELGINTLYIMNRKEANKTIDGIQIKYKMPFTLNELKKYIKKL